MPMLDPRVVRDTVFFDREQCEALGERLADEYRSNTPFPHIVLDEFLPREILSRVVAEFPPRGKSEFDGTHSQLKASYTPDRIESPIIINLLNALNSAPFLAFLERMTGIERLLVDPLYCGGGLHETATGGHLSIHADFNIHPRLRIRRRMNLILFLNEGWDPDYGGALELWEKDMSACARAVEPVMARAVVFNTESDSFHGHPEPLTTPEGAYRRSIALYYYTAQAEGLNERQRTTDFRVRPGSADKPNELGVRMRELARDLTPPLLDRWLRAH